MLCISPAHPPHDPRVQKTIQTLSENHEVGSLLPWPEARSVGVLPFYSRLVVRLVLVHPLVLWHLIGQRPQVVHIFMPELLPLALFSGLWGCRVVYDVQENHRLKFDRKPRNNARLFRWGFSVFDRLARRHAYCVFSEESYLEEYQTLKLPFAVVHNFPDLKFEKADRTGGPAQGWNSLPLHFCYLGLITPDRGLDTMIAVVARLQESYPDVRLHLFGRCMIEQAVLERLPGYKQAKANLVFYGHVDQQTAYPIMRQCVAGLALLKSVGDYPHSYPSKLFEYMALGLPLITANYPLYRSVVDVYQCGFCVDPTNVAAITEKIIWLYGHSQERQNVGQNGQSAIRNYFNWQTEAKKLLELYQKIDLK